MRTFDGFVILESLKSLSPLAGWAPNGERVEERPGDADAPVWHVHWYRVGGDRLQERLEALAHAMRPNWYAHFWAGDDLCVILPGRYFWASVSDRATWQEFIAYGETVGTGRYWTESVPTQLPAWVEALLP